MKRKGNRLYHLLLVLEVSALVKLLVSSVSMDEGLVSLEHLTSVGVGLSDGRLSVKEIDLFERESLSFGNLQRENGEGKGRRGD